MQQSSTFRGSGSALKFSNSSTTHAWPACSKVANDNHHTPKYSKSHQQALKYHLTNIFSWIFTKIRLNINIYKHFPVSVSTFFFARVSTVPQTFAGGHLQGRDPGVGFHAQRGAVPQQQLDDGRKAVEGRRVQRGDRLLGGSGGGGERWRLCGFGKRPKKERKKERKNKQQQQQQQQQQQHKEKQ